MNKVIALCPLLAVSVASAASLCVSGPLTSYIQMSGGCTIGSVIFSDFTFGGAGSDTTPISQIQVQISSDNSGNPVLSFTGPFVSGPELWLDEAMSFLITAPAIAIDQVALVNPSTGKGGAAQVQETSQPEGTAASENSTLNTGQPQGSADLPATTPVSVTEEVRVSGGGSIQAVRNSIVGTMPPSVTGGGNPGGAGGGPAAVPEPNTVMLVGFGLIFCALLLRFSRKRA